jgi:hypothetical protein
MTALETLNIHYFGFFKPILTITMFDLDSFSLLAENMHAHFPMHFPLLRMAFAVLIYVRT